jgi:hypothetical protein
MTAAVKPSTSNGQCWNMNLKAQLHYIYERLHHFSTTSGMELVARQDSNSMPHPSNKTAVGWLLLRHHPQVCLHKQQHC